MEKKQKGKNPKQQKRTTEYWSAQHLVKHMWKYLQMVQKTHLLAADRSPPTSEEKLALRREFIPIYHAMSGKGTQNPVLRVACVGLAIATTSGSANVQVYSLSPAKFTSTTAFSLLFDEVRFLSARFKYSPNLSGAGITNGPTGLSVAVIDYDDNSAISSFDAGASYDTHRIYGLAPSSWSPAIWDAKPDFAPDQEWYDTASSTAVIHWKNYTTASHGLGTQSFVGYLTVEAIVQFRQFRN